MTGRRTLRIIIAAALSVLGVSMGAGPADADDIPWTVVAGSASAGRHVTFLGSSASLALTSRKRVEYVTCDGSTLRASAHVGAFQPRNHLLKIAGSQTKFSGCTLSAISLPVTIAGSGTWTVSGITFYGPNMYTTSFSHLRMQVSTADPARPCAFTISGSEKIPYANTMSSFNAVVLRFNLRISGVSGCQGSGVQDGDVWTITNASWTMSAANSPSYNPLRIYES